MNIADINTLTRFLTKTDTTSYTAAQLLIAVNRSYERIVGKIIEETSGARLQFGDFNYTAFPTFTLNLVNGTQQYALTDLSTDPLTIMGVEVLDNNGEQRLLTRTSLAEIHAKGIEFDNYQSTDGLPNEYEIRDNFIVLYPAPATANVTLTNGLIVYYLRTAQVFTSAEVTTGTKEPGFPSPYHDIIAYEAAYLYGIANGLPNTALFKVEMDRKEKELLRFISKRDQDESSRPIMTNKKIEYF